MSAIYVDPDKMNAKKFLYLLRLTHITNRPVHLIMFGQSYYISNQTQKMRRADNEQMLRNRYRRNNMMMPY